MGGGGTTIYSSINDFEADLPLRGKLLQLQPGRFRARITWLELPRVRLFFVREAPSRIAYLTSPLDHILIAFPGQRASPLVCDGVCLRPSEAIIYGPGSRFHQRTGDVGAWGAISIAPSVLVAVEEVLLGRELVLPSEAYVWRLRRPGMLELLGLHRQAMRLAESALDRVAHPEIVRSLEDDLVVSIVRSLANSAVHEYQNRPSGRSHAMQRLEELLDLPTERFLVSDLHNQIGLTKSQLNAYSRQVLGVSVARYSRLRRLKKVRELVAMAPSHDKAEEVLRSYGFKNLELFNSAYRRAFGERGDIAKRFR